MIDDLKINKSLQEKTPDDGGQLRSLSEVHSSITVPEGAGFWKKMAALKFVGLAVFPYIIGRRVMPTIHAPGKKW